MASVNKVILIGNLGRDHETHPAATKMPRVPCRKKPNGTASFFSGARPKSPKPTLKRVIPSTLKGV